MIAEISTALTAIKSMAELTKLITNTKIDAAVREKAFELQSALLSLQSDMFAIQAQHEAVLQEKKELEQKIARFEQWESEAARYELKEIAPGAFVYAIKPESQASEPSHYLCPDCYQTKYKSILQNAGRQGAETIYACARKGCAARFFGA